MKTFRQILAIARTEFRFAFRRGAPVAVTALIGLIVSAGILLEPLSNLSQTPKNLNMTPEQVARLATIGLTPGEWAVFVQNMMADMFVASTVMAWLLIFTALLFLPMATSGSIPADRKFGVSEILRSMPITGSTYLAGKVLGMLAAPHPGVLVERLGQLHKIDIALQHAIEAMRIVNEERRAGPYGGALRQDACGDGTDSMPEPQFLQDAVGVIVGRPIPGTEAGRVISHDLPKAPLGQG